MQPFSSVYGGITRFNFTAGLGAHSPLRANRTLLDYNSREQNGSRYYTYPRGTGAAGSSQINALVDGTGSLKNYDNFAQLMKDRYWSGENMLRLFKKMESHPLAAQHPRYYGDSGWLKLRKPKPEDIDQIIFEIARKRRIPFREYERRPGSEAGVFYTAMRVCPDGLRSYSYKDLLLPTLQNPAYRLTVKFNSLVEKVLLRRIESFKSSSLRQAHGRARQGRVHLQPELVVSRHGRDRFHGIEGGRGGGAGRGHHHAGAKAGPLVLAHQSAKDVGPHGIAVVGRRNAVRRRSASP